MKKNLITLFMLLFISFSLFGQDIIIGDFESAETTPVIDQNDMAAAVVTANPDASGINISANVLQVDRPNVSGEKTLFLYFEPELIPLGHPTLSLKAYSESDDTVFFYIVIDNDVRWEQQMFNHEYVNNAESWYLYPGDGWKEFEMDLSRYPSNRFMSLTVRPSPEDTTDVTMYLDDIVLEADVPVTSGTEVVVLYEPAGAFRWVGDWANGAAEEWAYWSSGKFTPGAGETLSLANGWNWDADYTNDLPSDTIAGASSGPAFIIGPQGTDNNVLSLNDIDIHGFDNLVLEFDGAWTKTEEDVSSTFPTLEANIDGAGWTAITGTGYESDTNAWATVRAPITGTGDLLSVRFSSPVSGDTAQFLVDDIFVKGTQTMITSVHVSGQDGFDTVSTGGTLQMVVDSVLPLTARQDVGWEIINGTSSATISTQGLLTADTIAGTVTVRATTLCGNGVYGEKIITIADIDIPVDSIAVTAPETSIEVDESVQCSAEIFPANATDQTVSWDVDNTEIAVILGNGILTGVSAGTVTVTATANDGSGVTGTIDIEVTGGGQSGIEDNQNTSFNIYPNPVNEMLYISNAENIEDIAIIDVTGNLVYYDQNESDLMTINTYNLKSGLYFIRIKTNDNRIYYNKFIKE